MSPDLTDPAQLTNQQISIRDPWVNPPVPLRIGGPAGTGLARMVRESQVWVLTDPAHGGPCLPETPPEFLDVMAYLRQAIPQLSPDNWMLWVDCIAEDPTSEDPCIVRARLAQRAQP